MELYLMQHGPYLPKEQDPDEGLSPEGDARIHASAKALRRMGITFDAIFSSPKKRSGQTAAIVAGEVGFPPEKIAETDKVKAMAPPDETVEMLCGLWGYKRVLIAGHLPSVGAVASSLLTEGSKATIAFEMGGCCRIDVDTLPTHAGQLKWYLTPDQLELIASSP
jgi:phosphohistidine phosphatase